MQIWHPTTIRIFSIADMKLRLIILMCLRLLRAVVLHLIPLLAPVAVIPPRPLRAAALPPAPAVAPPRPLRAVALPPAPAAVPPRPLRAAALLPAISRKFLFAIDADVVKTLMALSLLLFPCRVWQMNSVVLQLFLKKTRICLLPLLMMIPKR